MDRYASHEALARDGAFLRHRAVRASDQARVLVISASPVADPNAAQRALERFARAHASTDHPLFPRPVPLGVDGVGEADGVAFVELPIDVEIDLSTALERLVSARGMLRADELEALTDALLDAAEHAAHCGQFLFGLTLSSIFVSTSGLLSLVALGHPVSVLDENGRIATGQALFRASSLMRGEAPTLATNLEAVLELRRSLLTHLEPGLLEPLTSAGAELRAELAASRSRAGIRPDEEALRRLLSDLATGLPPRSDWALEEPGAATEEAVVVAQDATWIDGRSGRSKLGPSLRRLLSALLLSHRETPQRTLTTWELLEAGWPGENVHPEPGANRVYAALCRLRAMGLRDVLARHDDGYRIAPGARVVLIDAEADEA